MTRTYRILIGVVVLAAAGAAYWMLLLAPKRLEARDLSSKVADAQAQLAVAQADVATYQHAEKSYRKNYETVVRLGKAVPSDDDTRSLMVQVDGAAKRSGIDFDNIDLVAGRASAASNVATKQAATGLPPGAVSGGNFAVMPFALSFSGEFGTLSSFFSRLDRFVTLDGDKLAVNGRLLRVESLSLKPVNGGWPSIQAQVGVSAYVSPQSTGATATAPAGTAATGATTTGATTTTSPTTSTSDLR